MDPPAIPKAQQSHDPQQLPEPTSCSLSQHWIELCHLRTERTDDPSISVLVRLGCYMYYRLLR